MTLGSNMTEYYERLDAENKARTAARKAANMAGLTKATRAATYAGTTTQAAPKEPEPVRDESYRRWVASLPCYECGIVGYSQAAHPNSGKAKGVKLSDDLCFPMCCDRPGVKGCHARFDQYELVSQIAMAAYEQAAQAWTKEQQGEKA